MAKVKGRMTKGIVALGMPFAAVLLAATLALGIMALLWEQDQQVTIIKAGVLVDDIEDFQMIQGSTLNYHVNVSNPADQPMAFVLSITPEGPGFVEITILPSDSVVLQPGDYNNWTIQVHALPNAPSGIPCNLHYQVTQSTI